MDYEKKYKEAIELMKDCIPDADGLVHVRPQEIFPELKESEDERVKIKLIGFFKGYSPDEEWWGNITQEDILVWLEKQGEQKPADKVEPKFKVGDWIVSECNGNIYNILGYRNGYYHVAVNGSTYHYKEELFKHCRLWTIQDAKDGDVLSYVTDEEDLWIMIYWSLYESYEGHVHYHALLVNNNFSDKGTCCICIDNLKPATKEQRDTLFAKMREAGYEWNAEKKEMKKIEQKPADNKGMNIDEESMTPFQKKVFCIIDTSIEEEQGLKQVCDELLALASNEIEQKSSWSKKDEEMFNLIIARLHSHPNVDLEEYSKEYNWLNYSLKSLKGRVQPQPKQEWSKKDEEMLQGVINDIAIAQEQVYCKSLCEEEINWLKSLRLQSHWKPSEEQMTALNLALAGRTEDVSTLRTLYSDLKKLRKE